MPDSEFYRKTVFDNGLRVLTSEMPHTRSASIAFFIGVGSRYELDGQGGLSHFLEHMLFKGTAKRPTAKDISEAIEGVGGLLNAATSQETTVYWAKVAQPHYALALDVLVDMLLNSKIAPEEIEKERKVILEEIKIIFDTPSDLVTLLIDQVLWGEHPLGRDIAGTKETVSRFQREDLLAYLVRHYSPDTTVVSVAGNVTHDQAVDSLHRALGGWRSSADGSWQEVKDVQAEPRHRIQYKDTQQAHICLAVPGLSLNHPERFTLGSLNTLLGEGMSSRLFQEVREKRGLAYDVHSYVNRFQDTGSVVVYAGVEPNKAVDTIQAILGELARMKDAPVSPEELSKVKELSKGRLLLGLEDSRSVASWLGSQELLSDRILIPDEVVERIEAVTADDVQRVAKSLFVTEKLNLAVVGPLKNGDRFARLLAL